MLGAGILGNGDLQNKKKTENKKKEGAFFSNQIYVILRYFLCGSCKLVEVFLKNFIFVMFFFYVYRHQ